MKTKETNLWALIESIQQSLELRGFDAEAIDAAVMRQLSSMFRVASPPQGELSLALET